LADETPTNCVPIYLFSLLFFTSAAMTRTARYDVEEAEVRKVKEALNEKVALVELNSPRLFTFARECYLREGRGALFFFFKTRQEVFSVSDNTPYRYVDLCKLVPFRDEQVCNLTRKYNVNECFVLLLAGSPHDDPDSSFESVFFYSKIVHPASAYENVHQEVARNLLANCGIVSAAPASPASKCAGCNTNHGLLQCAKCKRVKYCSSHCQRAHWRVHKQTCVK
jgi:hypothetical protein